MPPKPTLRLSEAEFQQQVLELAKQVGWSHMFVRRTRGKTKAGWKYLTATSVDGWPDLTMWHPGTGQHMLVELKADDGELSPEQEALIPELRAGGFEVHVWFPRDWDEHVQPRLTRHMAAVRR